MKEWLEKESGVKMISIRLGKRKETGTRRGYACVYIAPLFFCLLVACVCASPSFPLCVRAMWSMLGTFGGFAFCTVATLAEADRVIDEIGVARKVFRTRPVGVEISTGMPIMLS